MGMTGNQDRAARAAAWADARQDDLMAIIDADLAAIKAAAPTSDDPGAAERRVRVLVEVELWEVSLVTFPMLPGARFRTG